MTCPACGTYAAEVTASYRRWLPCPYCQLPALAARALRKARAAFGRSEQRWLPEGMPDGRPIAKPGLPGLGMYLGGARVRGLLAMADADDPSVPAWLDFSRAYGWWRPLGDPDAARIRFTGQFRSSLLLLPPSPGQEGPDQPLLWSLMTWEAFGAELELYAALGAGTLLHCPGHPSCKLAVIPTIVPPDAAGRWQDPECAPDRENPAPPHAGFVPDPLEDEEPPRLAELSAMMEQDCLRDDVDPDDLTDEDLLEGFAARHGFATVTLSVGTPGAETIYNRHWGWPPWTADRFAGMMGAQCGDPAETWVAAQDNREFTDNHLIWPGRPDSQP